MVMRAACLVNQLERKSFALEYVCVGNSGTPGRTSSKTWSQVGPGFCRMKLDLSTPSPTDPPWLCRPPDGQGDKQTFLWPCGRATNLFFRFGCSWRSGIQMGVRIAEDGDDPQDLRILTNVCASFLQVETHTNSPVQVYL